jgi:hypothetical protein
LGCHSDNRSRHAAEGSEVARRRQETIEEGTMTNQGNRMRVVLLGLLAGGMVFSSSCSTSDIRTVLAGIDAVTNAFLDDGHDDISFGDWLADEFD